ncbi:MAG: MipA/OmpV family protein, partial [Alteromonadales bacterium]|nr:MipA/OmpV family protein [Alteromonadales bacterium]
MVFKRKNIRHNQKYSFSWQLATYLLIFCLLLLSPTSFSQEVNKQHSDDIDEALTNEEHSANKPIIKDEFEWQFILDLSLVYDPKIIAGIEQEKAWHYFMPGILVDISYKGFFLQSNQRRSSAFIGGTVFGYQVLVEDNWQLDLIAKAYMQ